MKKIVSAGLVIMTILAVGVNGQGTAGWPGSSSSVSLNVGTLLMATPISVTYDHLWHMKKTHLGLSTGVLTSFYDGANSMVLGFYAAFTFLTGTSSHHFEWRLGGSWHPVYLYPDAGSSFEEIPFMPVIVLGYRYQKPGGNRFYRASVGTGGIGIGIGFVFGQKQKGETG
jgi:hypothetical protein